MHEIVEFKEAARGLFFNDFFFAVSAVWFEVVDEAGLEVFNECAAVLANRDVFGGNGVFAVFPAKDDGVESGSVAHDDDVFSPAVRDRKVVCAGDCFHDASFADVSKEMKERFRIASCRERVFVNAGKVTIVYLAVVDCGKFAVKDKDVVAVAFDSSSDGVWVGVFKEAVFSSAGGIAYVCKEGVVACGVEDFVQIKKVESVNGSFPFDDVDAVIADCSDSCRFPAAVL